MSTFVYIWKNGFFVKGIFKKSALNSSGTFLFVLNALASDLKNRLYELEREGTGMINFLTFFNKFSKHKFDKSESLYSTVSLNLCVLLSENSQFVTAFLINRD